jgi:hypothetical protein
MSDKSADVHMPGMQNATLIAASERQLELIERKVVTKNAKHHRMVI